MDDIRLRTERQRAGIVAAPGEDGHTVKVDTVATNPRNPPARSEHITDLVESVRVVGVLTPLLLTTVSEWLEIHPEDAATVAGYAWVALDGHRRLAAARAAGVETIPFVPRSMGVDDTLLRLHTGLRTLSLTPLEEAEAFHYLLTRRNMSQREIAQHVAVSPSHVHKRLQLLTLPAPVQNAVRAGAVSAASAFSLASTRATADSKDRDGDLIERVSALVSERIATKPEQEVEPISLPELIEEAEAARHRERSIDVARDRARAIGAVYADRPAEQLGSDLFAHRIHASDERTLRRAAKAHNLLVTPSPAANDTEPQFWHITPPQVPATADDEGHRRRESKYAREARWPFLVKAADNTPSAELLHTVLIETLLTPTERLADLYKAVRVLADEHHLLDDIPRQNWVNHLHEAGARDQVAWLIALAHREIALRARTGPWKAADRNYLRLLADLAGYTPTPWESEQLGNQS